MRRWTRSAALVPWIAVAFGVLLQLAVREGVFYSGDGGVKYLLARQFARGEAGVDLRLPAEPWVRALWDDQGLYPLGPPFVYREGERRIAGQPVAFPALSAPFLRVLGGRGLYVLPVLSLALLAWRMRRFTTRMGMDPSARVVTESGALLASFVPLYAGMYWEHLPATALAWCGMAWVLEGGTSKGAALLAGASLGAATWLRPEALLLSALALGRHPRKSWPFGLGIALLAGGFLAFNLATYGRPLGAHGIQAGVPEGEPLVRSALLAGKLALYAPVSLAAAVLALRGSGNRSGRLVVLLCAAFLLVLGFLVPNQGGLQWGPRYAMVLVPPLAAAAGLLWPPRDRWMGLVVTVLLVLGAALNLGAGTRDLATNYASRVLPALREVERSGTDQVVVTDPHIAQEMATLTDRVRFHAFPWQGDLRARVGALAERLHDQGKDRFLLVVGDYEGTVEPPAALTLRTGRVEATGRLVGRFGPHYLILEFQVRVQGKQVRRLLPAPGEEPKFPAWVTRATFTPAPGALPASGWSTGNGPAWRSREPEG